MQYNSYALKKNQPQLFGCRVKSKTIRVSKTLAQKLRFCQREIRIYEKIILVKTVLVFNTWYCSLRR